MKAIPKLLAATAIAAALVAAGCGDDEEEPATTAAETTETTETGEDTGTTDEDSDTAGEDSEASPGKAKFIKRADEICTQAEEDQAKKIEDEYPDADPTQMSDEEVEQITLDVVVPALRAQLDGIRGLTPPEGDEETVAEITDNLDEGIGEIEDDPSSIRSDSPPEGIAKASALAQDYGFKECGS